MYGDERPGHTALASCAKLLQARTLLEERSRSHAELRATRDAASGEGARWMTQHTLKVWPELYDAIESGVKTWEFRRDDRGFRVGDELRLEWWNPAAHNGRGGVEYVDGPVTKHLHVRVTYIFHGGRLGVPEGFCIMSIERMEEE